MAASVSLLPFNLTWADRNILGNKWHERGQPARLSSLALPYILFHLLTVDAAILWGQHGGDFLHHGFSGVIDVLARDFTAFGLEDDGFAIGDSDARAKFLQRVFATPDRHRHNRHTGAQGDHANAGMGFAQRVSLTTCAFWKDDQHLA